MTKNIDWGSLGFVYQPTDYSVSAIYKDGKWGELELTADHTVHISECACVLQYAQTVFEGLKAYRTPEDKIVTFRPDLNAQRMIDSAERLGIPPVPEEMFMEALDLLVSNNKDWVPPYGSGATMYVRPFVYGCGPMISVAPAEEFEFRMICMPVGPYFKGGVKPIVLKVSDFDRAAPHGTGDIKAGLNYAMSFHAHEVAHAEGFSENMFLDAGTRTCVEETGGANFLFVTKEGKIVTPKSKSNSILPSITRRSLMIVAKDILGLEIEQREVPFAEVPEFVECGLCGTAAVIAPVGKINDHGKEIAFASGMDEMGPTLKKLYDTLTGIQMGTVEGPEGWIHEIK